MRKVSTSSKPLPIRAGWRAGPTGCSPPNCCVIVESRKAIRRKNTKLNWLFYGEIIDGDAQPQRLFRVNFHRYDVDCRDDDVDDGDDAEGSWKYPTNPTISTWKWSKLHVGWDSPGVTQKKQFRILIDFTFLSHSLFLTFKVFKNSNVCWGHWGRQVYDRSIPFPLLPYFKRAGITETNVILNANSNTMLLHPRQNRQKHKWNIS